MNQSKTAQRERWASTGGLVAFPQKRVRTAIGTRPPQTAAQEPTLRGDGCWQIVARQRSRSLVFLQAVDPLIASAPLLLLSTLGDHDLSPRLKLLGFVVSLLSLIVFSKARLYRGYDNAPALMFRLLFSASIIAAASAGFVIAAGVEIVCGVDLGIAWALGSMMLLVMAHAFVRTTLSWMHSRAIGTRSAVIVGASEAGLNLAARLKEGSASSLEFLGFFDDKPASGKLTLLGSIDSLARYVRENRVDHVFFAIPASSPRLRALIGELADSTTSVSFLPESLVPQTEGLDVEQIEGTTVFTLRDTPFADRASGLVKRAMDLVVASLASIMLIPVFVTVSVAIKLSTRGPIIFKQRRTGLNGREITIYKFRTMTVTEDGGNVVQAKKNDPRVYPLGAFLRRTSLDELPQLFNVLQGRMSLVGPRPHVPVQIEQYRPLIRGFMLRHKVKPGITGFAQVSGHRGETDTLEKMQARYDHDIEYIRRWTPGFDLLLLVKTARVLFGSKNAY